MVKRGKTKKGGGKRGRKKRGREKGIGDREDREDGEDRVLHNGRIAAMDVLCDGCPEDKSSGFEGRVRNNPVSYIPCSDGGGSVLRE